MGPLTEMKSSFLGERSGVSRLSHHLKEEGIDLDQFQALLSLLMGSD